MGRIIFEKQDLTWLKWSHIRGSSGTAGTLLKSYSEVGGVKRYYKLSGFDPYSGITGHECVNELIADRLLTILEIEHLSYDLINADIEVGGKVYNTWLCSSEDYRKRGESKIALDDFFRMNAAPGEYPYDFCVRQGFGKYVDRMIAFDFIILNRDRHGANIEILRNSREHSVRPAPLFDHGLSLLCSCSDEREARLFDVMEDRKCGNFIGGRSCFENLLLIGDKKNVFPGKLISSDRERLLEGLDGVLPDIFLRKIWEMIISRYELYENL